MKLDRKRQLDLALGVVLMEGWADADPEVVRDHIAEEYGRGLPLAVIREAQATAILEKAEALLN